jgi:UDP-4-amino-4,6-dideoxy-N-acetyl-beta-L-altrosamine N-acetyltransferase
LGKGHTASLAIGLGDPNREEGKWRNLWTVHYIRRVKPILKYGIELRPMQAQDLERVRRWRNAPHVRRTMAFQELITPSMQQVWWNELNRAENYYYVIEHQGEAIGVIHAKDIDWAMKTAETGIFVGNRAYLGTFVPVLAVLALMDELFEELEFETLTAKVMEAQRQTMEFNRRLGYETVSASDGFCKMQVTRQRYLDVAGKLREMARRLNEK